MTKFRVRIEQREGYPQDRNVSIEGESPQPRGIRELSGWYWISEPGTYEVEVTKVAPRAARINIAPSHEGQCYPYICGHCGGLLNNTQVTCDRCGRTLGQVKELADLRIGGDGKPLVDTEE